VHRLVQLARGTVALDCKLGTRWTFRFPIAESAAAPASLDAAAD